MGSVMSKKKSDYRLGRCFKHNKSSLVVQERRRVLRSGGIAKHPNFVVIIRSKPGELLSVNRVGDALKGIGLAQLIKTNFTEV